MLICNAALQIVKKPGDRSTRKDFEGLLYDRPEALRMILSQAGFQGSSVTWSPNLLLDELLAVYKTLSQLVHNSHQVGTLPFTGWCLGGPCALHSTLRASSAPLHRPLGPSVAQLTPLTHHARRTLTPSVCVARVQLLLPLPRSLSRSRLLRQPTQR